MTTHHRIRDGAVVAGFGLILVAAWQLLVVVGNYPRFLLPGPLAVADRLVQAIEQGILVRHLEATLLSVGLGLLVGVSTAIGIGVLLARSRFAERLLSPYIVAAQATPILALAPLIVLWFGTGLASKVLICALICFFPMAVATTVGLRSVDAKLLELARSLRATHRQILTQIEIPAALPQIFGGLKVAVTLAVVGAIVAEWVVNDEGLGVLLNLARASLFDTPLMFVTLLTIALIGVALYLCVVALERRLTGSWR
jgi:NitT/TauT family transport system permease protein